MTRHASAPTVLLSFLLAVLASDADAQQRMRMSMPNASTFTVTAESGVPEVPFRVVNNHLLLSVSVNGSPPLDVILDTGMPAPGLALHTTPETEALDLEFDPSFQAQVRGAGGDGKGYAAKMAPNQSIAMEGLTIDGTSVILMPALRGFAGYHQGVIGYSLFERFVVELDFEEGLMRLHPPESYAPPPDAIVLPITFHHRVPYVNLGLTLQGGERFEALVVVDLGASHAISLNADWSDRIVVPEEAPTAILGRGLSGPVNGKVDRIAALDLGGAVLRDVVASFPVSEHQNPRGLDSLAGNLGSEVLRRFRTTFDYKGQRMVLQPNRAFDEPFRFDRSGLRLLAAEALEVEGVMAGSPAEASGVRVGDVVTHVNGRPVGGADYGDVREVLMGTGDVRLSIARGDERLEITLTLRRLV